MNELLTKAMPNAKWHAISPGRVNLLGEHVDYNDGLVLPVAIDRYVSVAISSRKDDQFNIRSLDLDDSVSFSLKTLTEKKDLHGKALPSWALYPAGVAWALQQRGFTPPGLDAVISSNLPIGAGLSSSAAVELAFAVYWKEIGDWQIDRMNLAKICRMAENEYVGVDCGLMDQFACAHGVALHALYLDTRSLAWQPIPLPLKTSIVIADSSMQRTLSSSRYNERRQECRDALRIIQQHLQGKVSLRDVTVYELEKISRNLPDVLLARAQHVIEEIERVKQGCQSLFNGNPASFGQLMVEGHISLRDLFEVSTPQLDALVEIAIRLPGCYGARLTGAGFGGCTVNLVDSSCSEAFVERLKSDYHERTGLDARVYICKPSRGVHLQPVT